MITREQVHGVCYAEDQEGETEAFQKEIPEDGRNGQRRCGGGYVGEACLPRPSLHHQIPAAGAWPSGSPAERERQGTCPAARAARYPGGGSARAPEPDWNQAHVRPWRVWRVYGAVGRARRLLLHDSRG